jgi:ABC-type uncharacterized transport system substrate-binding protein
VKRGNRQRAVSNTDKAKIVLLALGAALFALCSQAQAQQSASKIPIIGVLLPDTAHAFASYVEALLEGLHDLGYVPDRNILIEYRYADGKRDRFPELATDLVRLKVDAILVVGGTIAAAKQATSTIPIVAATAARPCGQRLCR